MRSLKIYLQLSPKIFSLNTIPQLCLVAEEMEEKDRSINVPNYYDTQVEPREIKVSLPNINAILAQFNSLVGKTHTSLHFLGNLGTNKKVEFTNEFIKPIR